MLLCPIGVVCLESQGDFEGLGAWMLDYGFGGLVFFGILGWMAVVILRFIVCVGVFAVS